MGHSVRRAIIILSVVALAVGALPCSAARAETIPIPARFVLQPQDQPFDLLYLELLYQGLLEIEEDDDEELEVGEMIVLALLKRQRVINSLPTSLPIIPLAGGWRMEEIPLDDRPFLSPEIEEIYRDLKEQQALGELDGMEAAVLAFIERTRARLFMPWYRVVGPGTTKSLSSPTLVKSLAPADELVLLGEKSLEPVSWGNLADISLVPAGLEYDPGFSPAAAPLPAGNPVPEPATLLLIGAALGMASLALRRK